MACHSQSSCTLSCKLGIGGFSTREDKYKYKLEEGDQYGNILAGMESLKHIIKTREDSPSDAMKIDELNTPLGFTTPLLTTSNGQKFGKSAGNAIWLDKDLTSTFDLYQYFLRTSDADVERMLKLLTFIPLPEINILMQEHSFDPSKRVAQHRLAHDFVMLIHGKKDADAAALEHRTLFSNRSAVPDLSNLRKQASTSAEADKSTSTSATTPTPAPAPAPTPTPIEGDWNPNLNKNAPQTNWTNMPSSQMVLPKSLVHNQQFHKILWSSGLVSSKSEGHRLIANKGAYVGSLSDGKGSLNDGLSWYPIKTDIGSATNKYIIDGDILFLKVGKWKIKTVKIIDDQAYIDMGGYCPGWIAEDDKRAAAMKEEEQAELQRIEHEAAQKKVNDAKALENTLRHRRKSFKEKNLGEGEGEGEGEGKAEGKNSKSNSKFKPKSNSNSNSKSNFRSNSRQN